MKRSKTRWKKIFEVIENTAVCANEQVKYALGIAEENRCVRSQVGVLISVTDLDQDQERWFLDQSRIWM